jgi:hypothetical protein
MITKRAFLSTVAMAGTAAGFGIAARWPAFAQPYPWHQRGCAHNGGGRDTATEIGLITASTAHAISRSEVSAS